MLQSQLYNLSIWLQQISPNKQKTNKQVDWNYYHNYYDIKTLTIKHKSTICWIEYYHYLHLPFACYLFYYSDTLIIVENRLFSTYAFSAFQRFFSCVFRKSQLDFKISSWYLVKNQALDCKMRRQMRWSCIQKTPEWKRNLISP